jgi:hypothetical protein
MSCVDPGTGKGEGKKKGQRNRDMVSEDRE